MSELYYVFLKDSRVMQVAVFASQNEELADRIAQENGFDDAVWVGSSAPEMFSTYNDAEFIPPTNEYLISKGIMSSTIEQETI